MDINVNNKREIVITCDIPCAERLVTMLSALGDEADERLLRDAGEVSEWLERIISLVKEGLVAPGELGSSSGSDIVVSDEDHIHVWQVAGLTPLTIGFQEMQGVVQSCACGVARTVAAPIDQ